MRLPHTDWGYLEPDFISISERLTVVDNTLINRKRKRESETSAVIIYKRNQKVLLSNAFNNILYVEQKEFRVIKIDFLNLGMCLKLTF